MRKHVNSAITLPIWPRGRNVQIEGPWLKCELDSERKYSLMKVYSRKPHVAFINVKSERELITFVQTWGPLSIPAGSPQQTSWMQTQWYWNFQRDLRVTAGLLRAFCQREGEEKALAEYLAVKKEQNRSTETPSTEEIYLATFSQQLAGLSDSVALVPEWNAKTDVSSRHRAIADLIEKAFTSTARMHADWKERTPRIEALWELNNLEDALTWMVFQDAIHDRLPQICPECQEVFRPSYRHKMKFCSFECAHRVAARNWRRRDSKRKRSLTRKER